MSKSAGIDLKNPKLNILLIGDYFPDLGGVTFYVHKLLLSLSEYGFRVILFHTKTGKSISLNNIYVLRIPSSNKGKLKALLEGLKFFPLIIYHTPFLLIKPKNFVRSLILFGLMHSIMLKYKLNK